MYRVMGLAAAQTASWHDPGCSWFMSCALTCLQVVTVPMESWWSSSVAWLWRLSWCHLQCQCPGPVAVTESDTAARVTVRGEYDWHESCHGRVTVGLAALRTRPRPRPPAWGPVRGCNSLPPHLISKLVPYKQSVQYWDICATIEMGCKYVKYIHYVQYTDNVVHNIAVNVLHIYKL